MLFGLPDTGPSGGDLMAFSAGLIPSSDDGGGVFVSGAVPMDAETMKIVDGDIKVHTVS